MDATKHTVTIPIADYNELVNNANVQHNAISHFQLLTRESIEIVGDLDFSKKPISAIVSYKTGAEGVSCHVKFSY